MAAHEWTGADIITLRALWDENLPTAEIGRRMGITKNSVIGKVHRLKLTARPSPIKHEKGPKKPRKYVPRKVAAPRAKKVTLASDTAVKLNKPFKPTATARSVWVTDSHSPSKGEALWGPEASIDRFNQEGRAGNAGRVNNAFIQSGQAANEQRQIDAVIVAERSGIKTRFLPRTAGVCCFPLGDPKTITFRFCDDVAVPGKPYCAGHCAVAYRANPLRERNYAA